MRDEFLDAGGMRLHYLACGPRGAPLMLFLHGFPESCLAWRAMLPLFADRWHAVALDLPGYNLSDKPAETSAYRASAVARVIESFMQALGYAQCVLVGHD